jgi:hypothetical protein
MPVVKTYKGRTVVRMKKISDDGILLTFPATRERGREKLRISQTDWDNHGSETYRQKETL